LREKGNPPLRLGLIGCGHVVERCHLPALQALDGIELVAVTDTDSQRLSKIGNQLGVRRRYDDYRATLTDAGVDVVAVCTPPQLHAEMGLAVLDAGLHLFLEKPIALTLGDADRMANRAADAAGKAMAGFNLRWHPLVRQAQSIIAGGQLGALVTMHTVFTSAAAYPVQVSDWRHRDELGGGVLFDLGIHHFDLWRFLTQCEVEELFAQRRRDESGCEYVTVSAAMANGVLVTSSFSHGMSDINEIEICGTKARLSLSCYRFDSLRVHRNDASVGAVRNWLSDAIGALRNAPRAVEQLRHGGDVIASYRDQWRHFIEAIRNQAPVQCNLDDGRRAVRATLAAVESASRGQPVRLAHSRETDPRIATLARASDVTG
jgi:myo-inositol 2-dehydrogenase/D-chiro-inositol 1-dehydrogenase